MGEVKATIKISNAMDTDMHLAGLIPSEKVRSVTVEAVVDTGAVLVTRENMNDESIKRLIE